MTPSEAYNLFELKLQRNLELEKIISEDCHYSYKYSILLDAPFHIGENAISQSSLYSFLYAKYVLKDQFPIANKIILNSHFKDDYISFLKSINFDLTIISEWLI